MKITRVQDSERPEGQRVYARLLIDGEQSNVRLIRLGPREALPPHRHGASELMLYAVSGHGELDADDGVMRFEAGALACFSGNEELRVRNTGSEELTLLAFLSPRFSPT